MAFDSDGSVAGGGEGSPSPMMNILAGRMMGFLAARDRERAEECDREKIEDAPLESTAVSTKDIETDLTKKTEGTDLTELETTQEKETEKAATSSSIEKPKTKTRKQKKAGK